MGSSSSYNCICTSRNKQKIILSTVSQLEPASSQVLVVSRATLAAASLGYPHTPVDIHGKAMVLSPFDLATSNERW